MSNPNITIKPHQKRDGRGFKLLIGPSASVQDYLDAINDYILKGTVTRLWPENPGWCEGCHSCCHEPAPVTLQDAYRLLEGLRCDLPALFAYLWVEEQDGALDITLRRRRGDACVFLGSDGRCTVYHHRPLVCQTYICCPTDPVHEQLRSVVVNQGEDALIRQAILTFRAGGGHIPVNRGTHRNIHLEDWPANRFSHVTGYQQIKIKDIVPQKLYRSLLQTGLKP